MSGRFIGVVAYLRHLRRHSWNWGQGMYTCIWISHFLSELLFDPINVPHCKRYPSLPACLSYSYTHLCLFWRYCENIVQVLNYCLQDHWTIALLRPTEILKSYDRSWWRIERERWSLLHPLLPPLPPMTTTAATMIAAMAITAAKRRDGWWICQMYHLCKVRCLPSTAIVLILPHQLTNIVNFFHLISSWHIPINDLPPFPLFLLLMVQVPPLRLLPNYYPVCVFDMVVWWGIWIV